MNLATLQFLLVQVGSVVAYAWPISLAVMAAGVFGWRAPGLERRARRTYRLANAGLLAWPAAMLIVGSALYADPVSGPTSDLGYALLRACTAAMLGHLGLHLYVHRRVVARASALALPIVWVTLAVWVVCAMAVTGDWL